MLEVAINPYTLCSSFVPRPVYAVLMLFPVTDAYEKARKEKDEIVKNGEQPNGIMFFKQTVSS